MVVCYRCEKEENRSIEEEHIMEKEIAKREAQLSSLEEKEQQVIDGFAEAVTKGVFVGIFDIFFGDHEEDEAEHANA